MKIVYSILVIVGLVWFVSCKSTTIEPISPSECHLDCKDFLNADDTQAVAAFLKRITQATAARTSQELLADHYNELGVAADLQGNNEQAVGYHTQALEIRQTLADAHDIAKSCNNLAIVQYNKGEYTIAQTLYLEAIELFHEEERAQWEAHTLRNYALMLQTQQNYTEAKNRYIKALTIWQNMGNTAQVALLQRDLTVLENLATSLGAREGDEIYETEDALIPAEIVTPALPISMDGGGIHGGPIRFLDN